MAARNNGSSKGNANDDLFRLRDRIVSDKYYESVHATLVNGLRGDAEKRTGLGTIEDLMIERVATSYVIIRDREAKGIGTEGVTPDPKNPPGFISERNYREVMATWFDMANKVQNMLARAGAPIEGMDEIRRNVEIEVAQMVSSVIDDTMPKAEAKALKARLATEVERREKEIPVA